MTAVASVAVGAVISGLIVDDAHAINARSQQLRDRGWGLIVLSNAAGGALDSRACIAAEGVDGVQAAGAVGPTTDGKALGLEAGLSVTPVSLGAVRISWPSARIDPTVPGLITPGLQSLAGLGDGVLGLNVGGALVPVRAAKVDGPGRYRALDGGLLVLSGDIEAPAYCLIQVPPERVESLALEIAAATTGFGTLSVPVVSQNDASPTPDELVAQHRDRHFPLIAGAVLVILSAVRLLRSRRDRAIYRLLLFDRADLWTMGLFEYLILVSVPVSSAFVTVLVVGQANGVPTAILGIRDAVLLGIVSNVVALLSASMSALGRNTHQFAPGA
jgi:hypothetical protein